MVVMVKTSSSSFQKKSLNYFRFLTPLAVVVMLAFAGRIDRYEIEIDPFLSSATIPTSCLFLPPPFSSLLIHLIPSPSSSYLSSYLIFIYSLGFGGLKFFQSSSASSMKLVKALTWNIAAINNNPFGISSPIYLTHSLLSEYWITNDDPSYNKLMKGVSEFIKTPAEKDIPIGNIFTEVYIFFIDVILMIF